MKTVRTNLIHTQCSIGGVEIRAIADPDLLTRLNEILGGFRDVAEVSDAHWPLLSLQRDVNIGEVRIRDVCLELPERAKRIYRPLAQCGSR